MAKKPPETGEDFICKDCGNQFKFSGLFKSRLWRYFIPKSLDLKSRCPKCGSCKIEKMKKGSGQ